MAPKKVKSTEVIKKRTERRTWSDDEIEKTIDLLLETIRSGKQIEKPNASSYYTTVLDKLNFDHCSSSQLKNQVYHRKQKYLKTREWRDNTGQGVLSESGEDTFKGWIF